MHECKCEHKVKVCKVCGNVYCVYCGKEWYKERCWSDNPYIYTQPYTQPYITYKWTSGETVHTDAGNFTIGDGGCFHTQGGSNAVAV